MFSFESIGLQTDMVVLVLAIVAVVLLIILISVISKMSKLTKRYENFMSDADGTSLENAFRKKFQNMEYINEKLVNIEERLLKIDENLLHTYQKVSVLKYDAFQEVGGTLSFILTMLTKDNDGFIINSMHSNSEGCYIYIKEVKAGEVFVTLSDEEMQCLNDAIEKEF